MNRAKTVPVLVAVLGLLSLAAILVLQHRAISSDDREEALRKCAGGQFDPEVVEAFAAVVAASRV